MWRCLLLLPWVLCAEISVLYLSWYDDPTTTMTVQWHTIADEYGDEISIQYPNGEWLSWQGEHVQVAAFLIHKVSLVDLEPDTEYSFRIGHDPQIYRFSTAPKTLEDPLRFVVGGDIYDNIKLFRRMSQTVLEHNPRFIVLSGDIAFSLSPHPFRTSAMKRWISFLKDWKHLMISKNGTVIPFLMIPGPHDIAPDHYELFFSLFAFPKKQLYRTVNFGNYLTLFLLDTGNFQPIEGCQTLWLEKELSSHTHVPYSFAVYHESAYPSHGPYYDIIPKKIRTYWAPLFEKYRLIAAFEHHNHAFKRTYPIKANQIDPDGIVYISNGGWGSNYHTAKDLWYLEKKQRKGSVLLVELHPQKALVETIDLLNQSMDQVTFYPIKK
ncbi:MAG: hypothetical protein ACD_17C00498G0002 [uncultured bacterium]|nr:MAG: hypothetical protein ACD_17C00498G0002 [uncultured bacterium]OGN55828.1 MAG: hypothetical protein A2796_04335 [Chlamydiae bacterium RIFCSPHIGHO2_01_FULL_44_39]OGN58331.1 MAG: hypothetical protein A3C42_01085 [Chlamydiae bacterium RIFCSPHIGHO2_02_FULL_45_9]OGN60360.1 MAG: hypothetical protein A3D96_04560 [Chlamydiae bacterium RIFCSPHIGHO2_12_FULL_44_59]OGN66343.1 MAG: hypothetical protein A2978_02005 [Chlamydiae bacterium RIFCSPLOWO2_01_FULL_44_52]OGN69294.1 MAG: hypothetical protein A3